MLRIGNFKVFLFCLLFACAAEAKIETVVLISVDGLGAHLLKQVETPNISRMIREGDMADRAQTTDLAKTIPSHVSMLTGVPPSVHKLTHNEYDDTLTKISVPSIFDLVKKNGLKTSAVVSKTKIKFVIDTESVDSITLKEYPLFGDFISRSPYVTRRETLCALAEQSPNFLFVHFAWVDTMGHWFKWESSPQRLALKKVDYSIGMILDALRENKAPGTYAVILTADHGGHEGSHGQHHDGKLIDPERDLYIPWIVWGAGTLKDKSALVHIEDTAPSVAELLSLPVPPEWNWQGKSVVKIKTQEGQN